jgi:predicted metal-binding protein
LLRSEREPAAGAEPHAELIVCSTCDEPAGERLLAQLKHALDERGPEPALALRSIECLWACERSCAVHLRCAGRMGYVLGGFTPDPDGARLLLAFVERYLASADGVVLVGEWPPGLRPHFVCRVPAAGSEVI